MPLPITGKAQPVSSWVITRGCYINLDLEKKSPRSRALVTHTPANIEHSSLAVTYVPTSHVVAKHTNREHMHILYTILTTSTIP